ncbi:uncharacterized protein M6B38_279485 [Iris pallida]|uniref:Late embryogenesis abundant protein LEA-2 subgroup domain-containing protein n=1 Tax=Iris pallida TaxID=29817 RepID=A0AAX6HZ03_IRIPA|nr:uncharacterized protein M6B38_279485 [Iris pallida]
MSADQRQKIHPVVDVEAAAPASPSPLLPHGLQLSDKTEPTDEQHRVPLERRRRTRRSCCCKCFCWTILSLALLLVLVAIALGVLYAVFDPKIPKYSVDRLRVAAFDVDANLTARATFAVTVTARNPNGRIGIYYEEGSRLSVLYSGLGLCAGSFPVFYQGHRNTSAVTVALAGAAQVGGDLTAALQRQQRTGSVPLEFRGSVPVRVKFGALKLRKMTSKVRCDLVVDSLSANNQIGIKSSSCKFEGFDL